MSQLSADRLLEYTRRFKKTLYSEIAAHSFFGPGESILDIGCRHGEDIQQVLDSGFKGKVVGVDIDGEVLRRASVKFKGANNVEILRANAIELPFKDDSFDLVYSSEVIEHIEDVGSFLREVGRVLKKGGVLIVTTPSRYNYITAIGNLVPAPCKKRLRRLVYHIAPGDENVDPHVREYTYKELRRIFENNKFAVRSIKGGTLRVPFWSLFSKFSRLLSMWEKLDGLLDKFSWGIHLKANFVITAVNTGEKGCETV